MTDAERIHVLIAYLQALGTISECSQVRVFAEIQRTIAEIERLLK